MKRTIATLFTVLSSAVLACSSGLPARADGLEQPAIPAFIPRPAKLDWTAHAAGHPAPTGETPEPAAAIDPGLETTLGKEGYRLTVTPETITVKAATPAGVFYARQTLAQAVVKYEKGRSVIPAMTIEDQPRFRWRGLMIDSARHFFPPADVKRMIDLMAMHKFNILHWHLTDDQGWRIEIKKYPKLTAIGSVRASSPVPGQPYNSADHRPYGGFYSQGEIKGIVAYAKARFVTVIPEIEMPGHASAAIASYPEFGNKDIPGYRPERHRNGSNQSHVLGPRPRPFAPRRGFPGHRRPSAH